MSGPVGSNPTLSARYKEYQGALGPFFVFEKV